MLCCLALTAHAPLSSRKATMLSRAGMVEKAVKKIKLQSHSSTGLHTIPVTVPRGEIACEETQQCGKRQRPPDPASQQKWSSGEAQKHSDRKMDVVITVCK